MNSKLFSIKQSFVILVIFTFSLFADVKAQCPVTINSSSNGKRIQLNGLTFSGVTNINVSGAAISLNRTLTTGNRTHDQEANNHFDPCFLPGNACSVIITHVSGIDACDYDNTGTLKVPLPIELISFELMLTEEAVISKWTTATEINNDFFTLERSKNAVNWSPIKIVDGAGNSNGALEYSIKDESPLDGTSYYRLKQTDFNGSYSYSEVQSVIRKATTESEIKFKVYPNPGTGNHFNYSIASDASAGQHWIKVYNYAGSELYNSEVKNGNSISELTGTITFDKKLSAGIYIVNIYNHNESSFQKLIVR